MYSKLSVTNEVQSIQGHIDAERVRRKTHSWRAGLILDVQRNNRASKIFGEPQRDDAADRTLVDDEVFLEPLHREGLGCRQPGLADLESVEWLDTERKWRVPVG